MTKEKFVELINKILQYDEFLTKLQNLHIDICAIDDLFIPSYITDTLFKECFGTEGVDIINYWLYESKDEAGDTIEELYDYLMKNENNA